MGDAEGASGGASHEGQGGSSVARVTGLPSDSEVDHDSLEDA
jgi:hypothetical protein